MTSNTAKSTLTIPSNSMITIDFSKKEVCQKWENIVRVSNTTENCFTFSICTGNEGQNIWSCIYYDQTLKAALNYVWKDCRVNSNGTVTCNSWISGNCTLKNGYWNTGTTATTNHFICTTDANGSDLEYETCTKVTSSIGDNGVRCCESMNPGMTKHCNHWVMPSDSTIYAALPNETTTTATKA